MFRDTLSDLERLVDVRGDMKPAYHILTSYGVNKTIGENIIYVLNILTTFDATTSESNAIDELERLATMKAKIRFQNLSDGNAYRSNGPDDAPEVELHCGGIFNKIIDSKIDFIKKGLFNPLMSRGEVEPMAALERLSKVAKKLDPSKGMADLLKSKIHEVARRHIPKASFGHDLGVRKRSH